MASTPENNIAVKKSLRSGTLNQAKTYNDTGVKGANQETLIHLITKLTQRIDLLETNLKSSIDIKIDDAVSTINNKINDLNKKIDNVETSLNDKLLDNVHKLKKASEDTIAGVYADMNSMSTDLQKKCEIITKRVDGLAALPGGTGANLDDRIVELERLSHSCDLIISGIPSEAANLSTVFNNICKAIDCNLDLSCTTAFYRLTSGSVMLKFMALNTKQLFLSKYLKNRNLSVSHIGFHGHSRIYINECLCKHTAALLRIANTMRRDGWIVKTYTKNGFLYIKKSASGPDIRITSKDQLLSGSDSG